MTEENELRQRHADAMLKSVERQRNEALTREVQKDAAISILQSQIQTVTAQIASLQKALAERDTQIADLREALEAKQTKSKKVA